MKNLRSFLLSLGGLLLVLHLAFVSPVSAQSSKKLERERLNQIMQPTADIEAFRQEFLNYLTELESQISLLTRVKAVRDKLNRNGLRPLETLAETKRSVAEMSPEQLTKMRAAYAKVPGWRETSQTVDSVLKPEFRQKLENRLAAKKSGRDIQINAATEDNCEDGFDADVSNTDISAAKAAEIAGELAMEILPTDVLTFEGHAVAAGLRAVLQGITLSLETLKAIKDDCSGNQFEADIQNQLTDTKNTIVNNDNSNKDTIVSNLNAAETSIINNDNTNKTTIINNDNANTAMITTAIETAKTTIIVNANANKDELLRLHIADDLAAVDSATPVAVFMLPAVKGGYIELVRTIVVQAITNLAGSSTAQANSFLAQGDAAKSAGDYKKAYFLYRKAYKTATN
jgi:hypothetical protein